MFGLGSSSKLLRTTWPRRLPVKERLYSSTKQGSRKSPFFREVVEDDTVRDFRPPWVYRASGFLIYTTIPIAVFYCVLFADYGDREHVFSQIRRWAQGYKDSFFALSPEEAALVRRQNTSRDVSSQTKAS